MIPRACRRCGRRTWVWPWQRPYCSARHFDTCLSSVLNEEPPAWVYADSLPPEDVHLCQACKGEGQVPRKDWETGYTFGEECRWCVGSGLEPVL